MAWVPIALAIASAAHQARTSENQRRAQVKQNESNANISAAQAQFSPWTGINPQSANQQAVTADPLSAGFGGAIQGGLAGAMYNQQNKEPPPTLTGDSSQDYFSYMNPNKPRY